MKTIVQLCVVF